MQSVCAPPSSIGAPDSSCHCRPIELPMDRIHVRELVVKSPPVSLKANGERLRPSPSA